ncbi:MAG: hypothetical protein MRK00_11335 [Nitrosomonas sp.]|nr:hypothetical protein [Nitrosomonas sp.]
MADRIDHHQRPKVEVEAYLKYLVRSRIRVLQIEDNPFDTEILLAYLDQTCYAGSDNDIGKAMGMQTIAKFVENNQIKAALKEIGINRARLWRWKTNSPD